jgi:hypothetical protein
VVNRRIQPYFEKKAAQEQRALQAHVFRRNQALGLVALAALVCLWWVYHTNPAWLFPRGWWRL